MPKWLLRLFFLLVFLVNPNASYSNCELRGHGYHTIATRRTQGAHPFPLLLYRIIDGYVFLQKMGQMEIKIPNCKAEDITTIHGADIFYFRFRPCGPFKNAEEGSLALYDSSTGKVEPFRDLRFQPMTIPPELFEMIRSGLTKSGITLADGTKISGDKIEISRVEHFRIEYDSGFTNLTLEVSTQTIPSLQVYWVFLNHKNQAWYIADSATEWCGHKMDSIAKDVSSEPGKKVIGFPLPPIWFGDSNGDEIPDAMSFGLRGLFYEVKFGKELTVLLESAGNDMEYGIRNK